MGVSADDGVNVLGQVGQHLGPAIQAGVDEDDFVVVAGCAVAEHDLAEALDADCDRVW